MRGLRAGTGVRRLEAPLGAPMMGYGARVGAAQGDATIRSTSRALYLANASDLLLVECDLCLVAPSQADALRARLAARTGVAAERILVGCIHTHSGPDTGFGALLAGARAAGLRRRALRRGGRGGGARPSRRRSRRASASAAPRRRSGATGAARTARSTARC